VSCATRDESAVSKLGSEVVDEDDKPLRRDGDGAIRPEAAAERRFKTTAEIQGRGLFADASSRAYLVDDAERCLARAIKVAVAGARTMIPTRRERTDDVPAESAGE